MGRFAERPGRERSAASWAARRSGVRSERDLQRLAFAAAVDDDRDPGSWRELPEHVLERVLVIDRLVVDLGHHVVGFDPRPIRWRSGRDIRDQRAHDQAVRRSGRLIELMVGDPQVWPVHVPGLYQLVGDVVGGVAVEGKTQPWTGLRLLDGEADANDLPQGIQQRTTAIARVDLGIRLDCVQDVFGAAWRRRIRHLDGAVQRADHALGHAVLLTEWTADGDRQLADLEGTRVAPTQGRKVLRVDFQHRNVILRAGAHDAGIVLLCLVAQDDLQ